VKNNIIHIQNIFDALNHNGDGVKGIVKEKCLYFQNRAILLASEGDSIVVSNDCPDDYCKYIQKLKNINKINVLKFKTPSKTSESYNSRYIFSQLNKQIKNGRFCKDGVKLSPYIHSKSFYLEAKNFGWNFPNEYFENFINQNISKQMNDKVILYETCKRMKIPIPNYFIIRKFDLTKEIIEILSKIPYLIIRGANGVGGLENMVIQKKHTNKFVINHCKTNFLDESELLQYMKDFCSKSLSEEFLINEFLDLYASPGTLFYIEKGNIQIISHTAQILSNGKEYKGFYFPIQDKLVSKHYKIIETYVRSLLEPWVEKGYTGYGNVDWMVTKGGEVFIAEMNSRQTAVVPPLKLISDIFKENQSTHSVISIPKGKTILMDEAIKVKNSFSFNNIFNDLRKASLLFDFTQKTGIIITLPPSLTNNKNLIGLLAIGDNYKQAQVFLNHASSLLI